MKKTKYSSSASTAPFGVCSSYFLFKVWHDVWIAEYDVLCLGLRDGHILFTLDPEILDPEQSHLDLLMP